MKVEKLLLFWLLAFCALMGIGCLQFSQGGLGNAVNVSSGVCGFINQSLNTTCDSTSVSNSSLNAVGVKG